MGHDFGVDLLIDDLTTAYDFLCTSNDIWARSVIARVHSFAAFPREGLQAILG